MFLKCSTNLNLEIPTQQTPRTVTTILIPMIFFMLFFMLFCIACVKFLQEDIHDINSIPDGDHKKTDDQYYLQHRILVLSFVSCIISFSWDALIKFMSYMQDISNGIANTKINFEDSTGEKFYSSDQFSVLKNKTKAHAENVKNLNLDLISILISYQNIYNTKYQEVLEGGGGGGTIDIFKPAEGEDLISNLPTKQTAYHNLLNNIKKTKNLTNTEQKKLDVWKIFLNFFNRTELDIKAGMAMQLSGFMKYIIQCTDNLNGNVIVKTKVGVNGNKNDSIFYYIKNEKIFVNLCGDQHSVTGGDMCFKKNVEGKYIISSQEDLPLVDYTKIEVGQSIRYQTDKRVLLPLEEYYDVSMGNDSSGTQKYFLFHNKSTEGSINHIAVSFDLVDNKNNPVYIAIDVANLFDHSEPINIKIAYLEGPHISLMSFPVVWKGNVNSPLQDTANWKNYKDYFSFYEINRSPDIVDISGHNVVNNFIKPLQIHQNPNKSFYNTSETELFTVHKGNFPTNYPTTFWMRNGIAFNAFFLNDTKRLCVYIYDTTEGKLYLFTQGEGETGQNTSLMSCFDTFFPPDPVNPPDPIIIGDEDPFFDNPDTGEMY